MKKSLNHKGSLVDEKFFDYCGECLSFRGNVYFFFRKYTR